MWRCLAKVVFESSHEIWRSHSLRGYGPKQRHRPLFISVLNRSTRYVMLSTKAYLCTCANPEPCHRVPAGHVESRVNTEQAMFGMPRRRDQTEGGPDQACAVKLADAPQAPLTSLEGKPPSSPRPAGMLSLSPATTHVQKGSVFLLLLFFVLFCCGTKWRGAELLPPTGLTCGVCNQIRLPSPNVVQR